MPFQNFFSFRKIIIKYLFLWQSNLQNNLVKRWFVSPNDWRETFFFLLSNDFLKTVKLSTSQINVNQIDIENQFSFLLNNIFEKMKIQFPELFLIIATCGKWTF